MAEAVRLFGAAEALRLLRPAVAVPVHFGSFRTPFGPVPDDPVARAADIGSVLTGRGRHFPGPVPGRLTQLSGIGRAGRGRCRPAIEGQGGIVDMFNMFSGGSLKRFSLFALGVVPYISASIIVQMFAQVIPSLQSLRKEGESGRRKLTQWTRFLTVALAAFCVHGMRHFPPQEPWRKERPVGQLRRD